MNVNSISSQNPASTKGSLIAAEDSQIRNLEQKLSQLNKEKDKAEKAKNLDKVRELEQKIQEVERRLEELRQKKAGKEKDETASSSPSHISQSDLGNYVDETV